MKMQEALTGDVRAPSLRTRLTLALLLAVLATAIVQATITWRTARAETEAVFDAQMERTALSLTGGLAASVLEGSVIEDVPGAQDLIIQIWRADGIMLYRSPSARLLPPQAVIGFSDIRASGQPYRVYTLQTALQVIQIAQAESARQRIVAGAAADAAGLVGGRARAGAGRSPAPPAGGPHGGRPDRPVHDGPASGNRPPRG